MFRFLKDNNQRYQIFFSMFQTKTQQFPKICWILAFFIEISAILGRHYDYFWPKTFLLTVKLFTYTRRVHNSLMMVLNWASLDTTTSLVHFGTGRIVHRRNYTKWLCMEPTNKPTNKQKELRTNLVFCLIGGIHLVVFV